jgi:hypothetical protein
LDSNPADPGESIQSGLMRIRIRKNALWRSDFKLNKYVSTSLTFMNSSSGQGKPLYMMSGEMISTSSRASCLQPSPVYIRKTGYKWKSRNSTEINRQVNKNKQKEDELISPPQEGRTDIYT